VGRTAVTSAAAEPALLAKVNYWLESCNGTSVSRCRARPRDDRFL
jgi:hypothetical protein